MSRALSSIVLFSIFAIACGGSSPPAKSADDDSQSESFGTSDARSKSDGGDAKPASDDNSDSDRSESSASKPTGDGATSAEPQFTEGMSVDEATKAVPSGIERRNLDQETLGKPLQDVALYEPCKPRSARVKIKVAVWDGRAVGIDVTSAPKNEKLTSCIKQRIAELKWDAKVKSLNTIEFQL